MRAAGPFAGLLTAALDVLKAAAAVWLVKAGSDNTWVHAAAACAVILGHNHSIFLPERTPQGKLRLRGGAGGAAAGGGAFGLWEPIGLVLIPAGLLMWNLVGYASLTTLTLGFVSLAAFTLRAVLGLGPWSYAVYALVAEGLMAWALRPNLKRLVEGTERRHGLPAYLEHRKQEKEAEMRRKEKPSG